MQLFTISSSLAEWQKKLSTFNHHSTTHRTDAKAHRRRSWAGIPLPHDQQSTPEIANPSEGDRSYQKEKHCEREKSKCFTCFRNLFTKVLSEIRCVRQCQYVCIVYIHYIHSMWKCTPYLAAWCKKKTQPPMFRVCIRKPQNEELNLSNFRIGLVWFSWVYFPGRVYGRVWKGFVKSMKPRGILGTSGISSSGHQANMKSSFWASPQNHDFHQHPTLAPWARQHKS